MVIVVDWTRPSSMVREIVMWLDWIERWASESAESGQGEEMRDRRELVVISSFGVTSSWVQYNLTFSTIPSRPHQHQLVDRLPLHLYPPYRLCHRPMDLAHYSLSDRGL